MKKKSNNNWGYFEREEKVAQYGGMPKERIERNSIEGLPERLLLVPAGKVAGRDKRMFYNNNPQKVLSAFERDGRDIPIDMDHQMELEGRGKAYGWVKALEVENGAIYGCVEWNSAGREEIEGKNYRYISPAFLLEENREIKKIESVGLVNKPNLYIKSLNSEGAKEAAMAEENSAVAKELCVQLGMSEGSSASEIVAKVADLQKEVTSQKRQKGTSGATEVVPKADYDVVLNRAEVAERALLEQAEDALRKEVSSAIDEAVEAGKIAPASKGYYVELCRTQEGLEKFKEFVKVAPKVVVDTTGTEGNVETNRTVLSADEIALCRQIGVSEETYLKGKGA